MESNFDPDSSAFAFIGYRPSSLRYDFQDFSKFETHSIILGLVKSNSRVLEIGCGTGTLGKSLVDNHDVDYVGVEPSKSRADQAKTKGLQIYNQYLTKQLVQSLGSLDFVVLADVLEHLADPLPLLSLIRSALSKDSRLIISVPNVAHWSTRIDLLFGRFNYTETGILDATHLRFFTSSSLCNFIEAAGFVVRDVKYSSGYTLNSYALLRRLSRFFAADKVSRRLIGMLTRLNPHLFGCQIICTCSLGPDPLYSNFAEC